MKQCNLLLFVHSSRDAISTIVASRAFILCPVRLSVSVTSASGVFCRRKPSMSAVTLLGFKYPNSSANMSKGLSDLASKKILLRWRILHCEGPSNHGLVGNSFEQNIAQLRWPIIALSSSAHSTTRLANLHFGLMGVLTCVSFAKPLVFRAVVNAAFAITIGSEI